MERVDTLIVGAGLAGCSLAWHLREPVLMLEQGSAPGAEATAQNAGMVRRLSEDPVERALSFRSFAFLEEQGESWGASRVTGAVLALAHDPWHLHDAVAALRLRGARVERGSELAVLQGAQLAEVWTLPEERVADGHGLIQGFLRESRAELRLGVQVQSLVAEGGRIVGVQTDSGPIAAERVVLAGGAWCAGLARSVGLERPLVPLRRSLMHSEAHPLSHPDHPWVWLDDLGLYFRPEGGGWLLSACDEAVDSPTPGPGSQGPVEAMPRALLLDKLDRVPALQDLRVRGGWTGLRTFAPDRRPMLGADELEGLWWIAGLGGFGVTCCAGAGAVVAAWMAGETVADVLPAEVSPKRRMSPRFPIRPTGTLEGVRLTSA